MLVPEIEVYMNFSNVQKIMYVYKKNHLNLQLNLDILNSKKDQYMTELSFINFSSIE